MSKQEFLDRLRMSLNSQMPAAQVTEHLRYYEDYINTEIRKGCPETVVLQTLGDPRLIARTIMDAAEAGEGTSGTGGAANQNYGYYQYRNTHSGQNSSYSQEDGYYDTSQGYNSQAQGPFSKVYSWKQKSASHPILKWVWIILGALIVFGIISAIFSLVSFLLPFIVPILIVVFITKLFRDWLQ